MSRAHWSADGRDLPEVEAHTKAKHRILEEYIENLIITLYGKSRQGETKFTFVDAFCGGGMYRDPETQQEWEGSPSRIINAVKRGYKKSNRTYAIDVQYIFIDSNKNHLDCLKNYSLPQAGLEDIAASEYCIFEQRTFEECIDWLIVTLDKRKGHSLFFLDPFGWTQVSMSSIRKINSLKKSEIIYTYMIEYIERFINLRNEPELINFHKILEASNYYLEADPHKINTPGEQSYLRNESMRLFRDKGNAKYVITFSLIPEGARGKHQVLYYLIHISSNLTALEVMKESFWKENTLDYQYWFEVYGYGFRSSDYYQEGQLELEFDITKDSESFCIERLDRDVGKLINDRKDGLTFREISELTAQKNPANRNHYIAYLNQRKNSCELEVIRKGNVLNKKKINFRKDDIIRVTNYKQLFIF